MPASVFVVEFVCLFVCGYVCICVCVCVCAHTVFLGTINMLLCYRCENMKVGVNWCTEGMSVRSAKTEVCVKQVA